jgi:hypothetical protein
MPCEPNSGRLTIAGLTLTSYLGAIIDKPHIGVYFSVESYEIGEEACRCGC